MFIVRDFRGIRENFARSHGFFNVSLASRRMPVSRKYKFSFFKLIAQRKMEITATRRTKRRDERERKRGTWKIGERRKETNGGGE